MPKIIGFFGSCPKACGTTSGMTAVASACSHAWNLKTTFIQSRNPCGDLRKKLQTEQQSDIIFVDCGSGEDGLSACLLSQADAVVVNLSQQRRSLDAYFQKRHVFFCRVVYVVGRYQQESVCNRKNLYQFYRLKENELGVIPYNPIFRHASDRGKTDSFVRRHIRCIVWDHQFYFMQELLHTTHMILRAAGVLE